MSRAHRLVAILTCASLPAATVIVSLVTLPARAAIRSDPALDRLYLSLSLLRGASAAAWEPRSPNDVGYTVGRALGGLLASTPSPRLSFEDRRAFAIYVAEELATPLKDERTWTIFARISEGDARRYRALANEVQAIAATASAQERSEAKYRTTGPRTAVDRRQQTRPAFWIDEGLRFGRVLSGVLGLLGMMSVVLAVLAGGPVLLRALGYELMAQRRPATRLRAGWRSLIAWSPALIGLLALTRATDASVATTSAIGVGTMLVMLAGAVDMVWRRRALQDVIAGTWIVPR